MILLPEFHLKGMEVMLNRADEEESLPLLIPNFLSKTVWVLTKATVINVDSRVRYKKSSERERRMRPPKNIETK